MALQNVRAVMSWYRQEIFRERQSGEANRARLEQLTAALRECVADQQALEQAGPEEAERITTLYKTRYAALTKE
ncbi:hypothetical protein [Streptomyces sp. 150FB]|uniref:hypothetical protein n=1 Tax=Streptomyces sp. 150FB TaxID=1576605 RepID=UPI000AE989B5|nr:hypothetical protein [Streptomyces sp. 150FB]